MDREDLLHYQRNGYNGFEENVFTKRKNGIQMPSFGTIEEQSIQKNLRQDESPDMDSNFFNFGPQPSYASKSYQLQSDPVSSHLADMRLRGEMEAMKRQQLQVLESLKQEMREIREIGIPNDRFSSEGSSTTSYLSQSDSKATYKELQLQAEKKSLEENLAAKMRIIERMLNSERELQDTIHQLRLELDNRADIDDINIERKKDQQLVDRLQKELKEVMADRERLATENGSMKRQMLRKQFETKLFMEDNIVVQDRQDQRGQQQTQRRCQELNQALKEEKQRSKQMEEELKSQLANLKQLFERKQQQLLHTFKLKQNQFYKQTKDQLQKLDKLKNRIVKDAKVAKSQYETFDTEVQYETVYGGLIARLEHQYTDKTSIPIVEYSTDIMSKVDDYQMRRLKDEIEDLKAEVKRLNNCIDEEQRKKRQFLTDLEVAKENSNKEKEGLKRELADLRIVMKEYQRMAQNTALELEVDKLNRKNTELERDKSDLERKVNELERQDSVATFRPRQSADRREREFIEQIHLLSDKIRTLESQEATLKRTINEITEKCNSLSSTIESQKDSISKLQKQTFEDKLYIEQIQSALKPIQPRLPGILKRKSLPEDESIIMMLQQQCSVLQHQVTDLEIMLRQSKSSNGTPNKAQGLMKQNTQLQQKNESLMRQNSQQLQKIIQLQEKVNQLSKVLEDMEDETEEIRRTKQNLAGEMQKEVGLYATSAETQRRLKNQIQEEVKRLREDIRRLEAEKQKCLDMIKDITREASKKQSEVKQSQSSLRSRELYLQKQLTRLISENTSMKKGYEQQFEKLLATHSEATRQLTEKYDKDIKQLQAAKQNLLNELKQSGSLQMQVAQLTRLNKQLAAQVKDKSMAVQHLWQIKRVEYSNIMSQLNTLKSRSRQ